MKIHLYQGPTQAAAVHPAEASIPASVLHHFQAAGFPHWINNLFQIFPQLKKDKVIIKVRIRSMRSTLGNNRSCSIPEEKTSGVSTKQGISSI
jgi:hypothetical protein